MNFFEAKAKAKRNTAVLVLLFVLAILILIVLTNILVLAVLVFDHSRAVAGAATVSYEQAFNTPNFLITSGVVLLFVLGGSLYKLSTLSSGGMVVAESLGGRLIPQNSKDPEHKKILNVVEEMAIASGTPVPVVYLLDDVTINAFAAGWSPNSAVIGVTQGTIHYLNREELQGVVAHEFSHIFNGDMRLNIRLISLLHGILLLGIMGEYLLRSMRYMRRSRSRDSGKAAGLLFVLGLGLMIIGYGGVFFGNWIKSIVSRQREYLADASAVQYTRNTMGIAGALKKIGGMGKGSLLESPAASEYSHAYFSEGVSSFLFSTHPPLKERIQRIEPNWDGEFILPEKLMDISESIKKKDIKRQVAETILTGSVMVGTVLEAIEKIGNASTEDMEHAQELLQQIPAALLDEARNPFGARAVAYSLLLHRDEGLRSIQWTHLQENSDVQVFSSARKIYPMVAGLERALRLPLFEVCFPALRSLSPKQYSVFRKNINSLILADKKIDLDEWVLYRLLKQQLDESFGLRKPAKESRGKTASINQELSLLCSLVCHLEHTQEGAAEKSFNLCVEKYELKGLSFITRDKVSIRQLDEAMGKLEATKPRIKEFLLKALVYCAAHDDQVSPRAQEFLRVVASCLGAPLPLMGGSAE
ncbi:MAG: M48 family metallopeptidase [Gammaproteobacteria bacterium]|nr:M48 family metallopeptidase [Gammaproteobacteria bacterium]